MQKLLNKEEVMEKKNSLLQPLFRDLKSQIKHMSASEEQQMMAEYMRNREIIKKSLNNDSPKCHEGLDALQKQYSMLLKLKRSQLEEPSPKLKHIQKS